MVKAHSPINWENEPSFNTPVNEPNLNKMDSTIGILDDRIITLDVEKLDKTTANNMVKSISFDESTGIFTITLLNGSTTTIDTKLEKIAINFGYNPETQKITLELIDGTTQEIDLSALITHYEFVDSDTIGWEVTTDGKVKAKVLDGSITEDMLQPNYLAEIKVETEKSAQSMANAKISENNAKQSELNAKASEEQALEYSNNAQPLAQSVSGNNPTVTNSTDGSVIYLNNKGYTQQDETPSPDNPIHIDGLADKGYFDGVLKQGYYSSSNGTYTNHVNYVTNNNSISCSTGDNIEIITEETIDSIIFFNANGSFIKHTSGNSASVPENATYFHFNVVKEGITPSTAKHICVTINGMYALRVKMCNKNLFKNTTVKSHTINGVSFTVNNDKSINVSGTATQTAFFMLSPVTKLKANTTYYLSGSINANARVSLRDSSMGTVYAEDMYGYSVPYTPTSDIDAYMIIRIEKGATVNGTLYPMVRTHGDATYQPHQETTALIPVSAPLYDGDYIKVYADGSGQIVRENTKFTFVAGSEQNALTNSKELRMAIPSGVNAYGCKCNKAIWNGATWGTDIVGIMGLAGTGNTHLAIRVAVDTDRSTFTADIVAKLITPTSTPLTAEQVAEFLKLRTYKGVTHVTADGDVVMRYYVDNANGETVSMLQGMVTNGGNGDVTELFKTITVSESATLPANKITSITIPIEVPSGYSVFGIKSIYNNTLELLYGFSCSDDSVNVSVKNMSELETQGSVTVDVSCIKTSAIS